MGSLRAEANFGSVHGWSTISIFSYNFSDERTYHIVSGQLIKWPCRALSKLEIYVLKMSPYKGVAIFTSNIVGCNS